MSDSKTASLTSSDRTRAAEIREATSVPWAALAVNSGGDESTKRDYANMLEDLASSESRVKQAYFSRYPIELLQNAHDACAKVGVRGEVWFEVTRDSLLVANQGDGFNGKRAESLMRLGASDKDAGHEDDESIGYKGIGFTSVFEIADSPQFFTDCGFDFELNGLRAKAEVESALDLEMTDVPHRRFLFELAESDVGSDLKQIRRYLADGAATVVRLPFKAGVDPATVFEHLRPVLAPELFVFMPSVAKITLRSGTSTSSQTCTVGRRRGSAEIVSVVDELGNESRWAVARKRFPVSRKIIRSLEDRNWDRVKRLDAAVALPLRGNRPSREADVSQIHVYFPTDESIGRRLLVHGDFYVDQARRAIALEGPGLSVNETVGANIAKLAASLAETYARDGAAMLECFAPIANSTAFGDILGDQIDEALATSRLVKSGTSASHFVRPASVQRIGAQTVRAGNELVSILSAPESVLDPAIDIEVLDEFLSVLGCDRIDPGELASLIDPSRTERPRDEVLQVVRRWISSIEEGYERDRALTQLADQPVLQNDRGKWRNPNSLTLGLSGVPLPRKLRRSNAAIPARSELREFMVEELGVEAIDPPRAVEIVVEALRDDEIGSSPAQNRDVFEFFQAMWSKHPDAVREHESELGIVPVRASTLDGDAKVWRQASEVYFKDSWPDAEWPSRIFGRFNISEFLDVSPPRRSRKFVAAVKEFYECLGVDGSVRVLETKLGTRNAFAYGDTGPFGTASEWGRSEDFQYAWRCPVHTETTREVTVLALDRIDEIIERVPPRTVAKFLASQKDPLGSQSSVRCCGQSHQQPGSGVTKTVGYQEWLLRESPWVPVRNDPSDAKFRKPGDAWHSIRGNDLALPKTTIPFVVAGKLKFLVDGRNPRPADVAAALESLFSENDVLDSADIRIQQTADWLLQRLERSLSRAGQNPFEVNPPLPAYRNGERVWSREPAILDSEPLGAIPDQDFTSPGPWRALARRLALERASELFESDPIPGPKTGFDGFLTRTAKAQLAAFLFSRGAEPGRIASRLDLLTVSPVANLDVEYADTSGSKTVIENAPFHLARKKIGGRWGGELVIVVPYQEKTLVQLSHELDRYLNPPAEAMPDVIALFLSAPSLALAGAAVTDEEIAALRDRMRGDEFEPEPEDLGEVGDESDELEPSTADLESAIASESADADDSSVVPPNFEASRSARTSTGGGGHTSSTSRHGDSANSIPLPPLDDVEFVVVHPTEFKIEGDRESGGANSRSDGLSGGEWNAVAWESAGQSQRSIGRRGEEIVLSMEKEKLRGLGLSESQAVWVADAHDTASYDVASVDSSGDEIFIEVKATVESDPSAPFEISRAELEFAEQHPGNYFVYRVVDAASTTPKVYVFPPLMSLRKKELVRERSMKIQMALPKHLAVLGAAETTGIE